MLSIFLDVFYGFFAALWLIFSAPQKGGLQIEGSG